MEVLHLSLMEQSRSPDKFPGMWQFQISKETENIKRYKALDPQFLADRFVQGNFIFPE